MTEPAPPIAPPARRVPGRRAQLSFFAGVLLVTLGVLVQLPDVAAMVRRARADDMGMAADDGMTMWTPTMVGGMVLVVVGLYVAARALFRGAARGGAGSGVSIESIEHGRLRPIYWLTCAVLCLALVIDIMKPLTLGFVLPGISEEYGMSIQNVAALPIVALIGTAVGSIVWGVLGDRYGRRTGLMFATLLFIATSACGAMPSLGWNLVMCFTMGASAGGLLPLVFTLIAELAPRRYRGVIAVAVGGVGGVGGYIAASEAAHLLEPTLSWRALWLIGLPTGLVLLLLTPLLPESPLYLLRSGRRAEAEAILARYGSRLGDTPATAAPADPGGIWGKLRRYPGATTGIIVVGIVWGLVNFGFLVLLPAQLARAGQAGGAASGLLAKSALYSAPALLVVVALYGFWSARRTLALFVGTVGLALAGMAGWATWHTSATTLYVSIGLLVLSLAAVNAMLLPYAAEIYPTAMRATGSGVAAAATKTGGVLGPSTMLIFLALHDGIAVPAVVLAVLSAGSAVVLLTLAPELGRSLSRHRVVTEAEPASVAPAPHG